MIRLTEFKNNLIDIVKPNRFLVSIQTPKVFNHNVNLNDMRFAVQAAQIPARTSGEISIKYHGMELKLPGDSVNENLTLTFLNKSDWLPRTFYESWMNVIQNITRAGQNTRTDTNKVLDDSFLIVQQLGNVETSILAEYKFYCVFPKNISASDLNMESGDSVQSFTVEFAYSYWERIK